jgi:hypothetical protein
MHTFCGAHRGYPAWLSSKSQQNVPVASRVVIRLAVSRKLEHSHRRKSEAPQQTKTKKKKSHTECEGVFPRQRELVVVDCDELNHLVLQLHEVVDGPLRTARERGWWRTWQ